MLKLASLFLALLLAVSARNDQDTPTADEAAFSKVPFDPSLTQLPLHFPGHTIVGLYHTFQELSKVKKNDYETTAQFDQRLAALQLKPVIGNITKTSVLAFVVPLSPTAPPPYDDVSFSSYDADKRLLGFEVQCSIYHPSGTVSFEEPSLKLRQSTGFSIVVNADAKSYDDVGYSVFGAPVATSSIHEEKYEVVWDNAQEYKIKANRFSAIERYRIRSSVPQIDPEAARRIRETLSALIICSVKDDVPTFQDLAGYSATLDHPVTHVTYRYFLNTTLLAVWFFDSSSGKVYARVQPKGERKK